MEHNIAQSNGSPHGILSKPRTSCPATNARTVPLLATMSFMLALLPAFGRDSDNNVKLEDMGEGWHRFSRTNVMTGKVTDRYILTAEGWDGKFSEVPYIFFNCNIGDFFVDTNSMIDFRNIHATELENGSLPDEMAGSRVVDVQISLDQGPHIEETWWVYEIKNRSVSAIGDQVSFWMHQLMAADTMVMRIPMFRKQPMTLMFDVSKAREILPDDGEGGCR